MVHNEASSAFADLGIGRRRRFTQKNHLPRKDVTRIIVKKIGDYHVFDGVRMDEPFSVENDDGEVRFFKAGSYLLKACADDGGELFGITGEEFKKRYILY